MSESTRMVDGSREPTEAEVADFIGKQNAARWADLTEFVAARYPGVFKIEWLFGGKKYGWTLRFKKSKSFCSLVPERRRFKVLLVFGGAEREKVERLCLTWCPTSERTTRRAPRTMTASGCSSASTTQGSCPTSSCCSLSSGSRSLVSSRGHHELRRGLEHTAQQGDEDEAESTSELRGASPLLGVFKGGMPCRPHWRPSGLSSTKRRMRRFASSNACLVIGSNGGLIPDP